MMTDEMKLVLDLVKYIIVGKKTTKLNYKTVDWNEVYNIACRNNIAPLLFDQIARINEITPIDDQIFQQWKQQVMRTSLMEYRKTYALRQIFSKAKENHISAVVFKGPVLANLYPNYALRSSCDTDFLIKEKEIKKIITIVESMGYEKESQSEDNVYTFRSKEYGHNIEMHMSLYGRHVGPRIDLLESMDLASEDTLIQEEICGIQMTTLGYVEHLIYLMFHMIKHFALEGIKLRHIIDVILYTNKYLDRISLNEFWNAMDKLSYTSCCKAFFSTGIRYMGLDARILGNHQLLEPAVCDKLLLDIMNYGLIHEEENEREQLATLMEYYLVGTGKQGETRKDKILRSLKPLNTKYNYAKRFKFLLPVCWIHKIFGYMYSKYIMKKTIYTSLRKIEVSGGRLQLFREIGLIEKTQ